MVNKRNGAADTDMPSNLSFNADVAPLNGLTPRCAESSARCLQMDRRQIAPEIALNLEVFL